MLSNKLARLHSIRIILGLGTSRKSAPAMPQDRATMPIVYTSRRDSMMPVAAVLRVGLKIMTAAAQHTIEIAEANMAGNMNLARTKLLTRRGEALMNHILSPSEPTT